MVNQSSAFKVIRRREDRSDAPSKLLPPPSEHNVVIQFNLKHYNLKDNETIYINGTGDGIGNWNLDSSLMMSDHAFPELEATMTLPRRGHKTSLEYKFIKGPIDNLNTGNARWENRENRKLNIENIFNYTYVIVNNTQFVGDDNWRGVGVAVPVFSLRSEESLGVGEFLDLKLLVDFANKVGLKLVQILPVNDTNILGDWRDSYPYSTLSVFALHPIYIRVQAIEGVPKKLIEEIQILKEKKNEVFVNYEDALNTKLGLLRRVFELQQDTFQDEKEYVKWFENNKEWLIPYAVFCSLRDKYRTCDYNTWDKYNNVTQEELNLLSSPNSEIYNDVLFNFFVQFNASKQLSDAAHYASTHQVAFKGDLPIGVDLLSCDTWINRHLFRMQYSTGKKTYFYFLFYFFILFLFYFFIFIFYF